MREKKGDERRDFPLDVPLLPRRQGHENARFTLRAESQMERLPKVLQWTVSPRSAMAGWYMHATK
jgi:hypothetical protein